jgi:hypothetical protein
MGKKGIIRQTPSCHQFRSHDCITLGPDINRHSEITHLQRLPLKIRSADNDCTGDTGFMHTRYQQSAFIARRNRTNMAWSWREIASRGWEADKSLEKTEKTRYVAAD